MSLRVALQMDPIEHVSIDADSTFRIGLEAEARGHRLFQYTPDGLIFDEGRLLARGRDVTLRAGILNLADTTYYEWANIRGRAADSPVITRYTSPGRSGIVSLAYGW